MSTLIPPCRAGSVFACMAALAAFSVWCSTLAAQPAPANPREGELNLVKNGSFETLNPDGVPAGWRTQGRKGIEQAITSDAGPEGTKALKLTCTKFLPGFPDSHAMAALLGSVGVKKGESYRLTWWAKGKQLPDEVSPALSATAELTRTGPWTKMFGKAFKVYPSWRRYEQVFEAPEDLAPENSRFSFYMKSTGTLWLGDVAITPISVKEVRREWWPQISTQDVTNYLPNSDFECDGAGWGGFAPYLEGSGGNRTNLPALVGEIDDTTAWHGKKSLRIHLDKGTLDVLRTVTSNGVNKEPIRAVSVANVGWIPVAAGQSYVFSCWVKADKPNVSARLTLTQPAPEMTSFLAAKTFPVGMEWQRLSLSVRPKEATFVWVAAGLDMKNLQPGAATLWVDAMQFEQGEQPGAYVPRAKVESFIQTSRPGNIFTDPAAGMSLRLVAGNAGDAAVTVKGRLSATDFFDREVFARDVQLPVPAGADAALPLEGILKGRKGFFRVSWRPEGMADAFPQSLRCAVIDEYAGGDSPFGMNQVYPWPLLCGLARKGGLLWMRDWSSSWDTIEREPGKFDFSDPEAQIDYLLANRLNPLVLLPSPSARWSSSADIQEVDKEVQRTGSEWARTRLICAWAPKEVAPFRNYVTRTVARDLARTRYFEIFNEPLFTEYSFPSRFGFKMKDYIDLLQAAWEAAKAAGKDAQVIGGISCGPDNQLSREFIAQGGLEWVDVMNLHWYPEVAAGPEVGEKDLADIHSMMLARNQKRPIWVTEFGCYAEDEPPLTPSYVIGDETMARSRWPSEREAAAGMVKYCALLFRYGTAKVFFHAGVSGTINAGALRGHSEGAGIFFRYGGAPRKMYPALTAMANLLGPDFEAAGSNSKGAFYAYWFRTKQGLVAVVWKNDYAEGSEEGKSVSLKLPRGVSALDLMGNRLGGDTVAVTETPSYLLAADEGAWKSLFGPGAKAAP